MRHAAPPRDPDAECYRLRIASVGIPVHQTDGQMWVTFTGHTDDARAIPMSVAHSLPMERAEVLMAALRETGARAEVAGRTAINVNGRVRSYFEASEVTAIGELDGAARAAQKQASRDADLAALESGAITKAELSDRNGFFTGLNLSTFRIHAIGTTVLGDRRS